VTVMFVPGVRICFCCSSMHRLLVVDVLFLLCSLGAEMVVNVCAEVTPGTKLNISLSFAGGMPLLESLFSTSTALFQRARNELCDSCDELSAKVMRRVSASPFGIDEAVIYNPKTSSWSLLASEEQLFPFCQVYLFQPSTVAAVVGIQDNVGQMPEPVKPQDFFKEFISSPSKQKDKSAETESRTYLSSPIAASNSIRSDVVPLVRSPLTKSETMLKRDPPASPPRNRRPSPPRSGSAKRLQSSPLAAPTLLPSEVTSDLFNLLDDDKDGVVTLFQLHDAMTRAGIDTSPATVGKTFAFGDRAVSESVFSNFVHRYWTLCVELLAKLQAEKRVQNGASLSLSNETWKDQLAEIENQESDLLAKLQALQKVKKVLLQAQRAHIV
jgi:hypothetical protein